MVFKGYRPEGLWEERKKLNFYDIVSVSRSDGTTLYEKRG